MNTDKLLKAIQILIKEELKEQLPALIKESVQKEVKRILAEGKQPVKPQNVGLSMAKAMLEDEPLQESVQMKAAAKQFSKNPMINQILNETAMAPAANDGGFRTMSFGQGDMGSIVGRTAIAEKMGYGDLARGPQPTGSLIADIPSVTKLFIPKK